MRGPIIGEPQDIQLNCATERRRHATERKVPATRSVVAMAGSGDEVTEN
jgi:hypothetical protein